VKGSYFFLRVIDRYNLIIPPGNGGLGEAAGRPAVGLLVVYLVLIEFVEECDHPPG
jgi:hypothetical protein